MNVRGSLATISLIVCAMGGCAARGEQEDPSEETPAEEEPLDVTVDSLDIAHGALRISATMVDGAADVSVRLGGDCEHREVGGGLSTLSTFVWSLGDADIAAAIGCGLLVRARVRDGARYVHKVAELPVAVDVAPQERNGDEGPQLKEVARSELGIGLAFAPVTRSARLTAGDSILEATRPDGEDDPAEDDSTGRFTVSCVDFARSVLRGRPLYLDGASFVTSLSVGTASLQGEPASVEAPGEAEEAEEAVEAEEEEAVP